MSPKIIAIVILTLGGSLPVVASEPNWANEDYRYQASEFSTYKTDPSTWAPDGGYGLRWGMGPGDVRARIPQLQFVFADSMVSEGQQGFVDETVNDLPVTIFFSFLRGRLYEIKLNPLTKWATSPGTYSEEASERFHQSAWKWRKSLLAMLESKLGKPNCAPSRRTLAVYCAEVAPLPGCGDRDMRQIARLFRWVWRSGPTETVLTDGPATLVYSDLAAMERVEAAKQRADANRAAQRAQAQDAEVKKLTGVNEVHRAVEATAVEDLPRPTSGEGDHFPPLQCFRADDEPNSDAMTPREAWAQNGWMHFRWGMGPADVRAALTSKQASTAQWDASGRGGGSLFLPSDEELGATVSTSFEFDHDRLASIRLTRECSGPPTPPAGECIAWASKVEASISKRCGTSRCTRDGKHVDCSWTCGPAEWPSLSRYDSGDFQIVYVSYSEPTKAPQKAADRIVRATKPPKSWSHQGWFDFRWGMGVADVQRRLSAPKGGFRAKRELACLVGERADEVDCSLEGDFHELTVVGLKPTLDFGFTAGKLERVNLSFPKHIDHDTFMAAAAELKALLIAKYGTPPRDRDRNDSKTNFTSLDWSLEDLRVSYYAHEFGDTATLLVFYSSTLTEQGLRPELIGDKAKL